MIYWIFGKSNAGKTTMSGCLVKGMNNAVVIDGDDIRDLWDRIDMSLDFSKKSRRKQSERIFWVAIWLHEMGHDVVIATICPFRDQREDLEKRFLKYGVGFRFVHIPGGEEDTDFEMPV